MSKQVKQILVGMIIVFGLIGMSFYSIFYKPSEAILAGRLLANSDVDHVASRVEKLKERLALKLAASDDEKIMVYNYMINKRYEELEYVLKNKEYDLIEPTASRYTSYLGFVNEQQDLLKRNESSRIVESINSQLTEMETYLKDYEYDSAYWLSIMHAINLAKDTVEQLQR